MRFVHVHRECNEFSDETYVYSYQPTRYIQLVIALLYSRPSLNDVRQREVQYIELNCV